MRRRVPRAHQRDCRRRVAGSKPVVRALWSGSLNFGLVTIPIKLYSATEDHDVALHQVHAADGGRIRYQRVCEICGNVIELRDIAKAFEAPDGEMVVISDEDFASLPADRSKQISVEQFAPAEQIDSLLFDRAYYLEPSKAAAKAYALLRTVLERTERVAVVRFALRQRTQLGALRVHDDVLAVQTLRWPDELRSFDLPDQVNEQKVSARELKMAQTLVESYSDNFHPEQFTDEYRDELEHLIAAKLEGGEAYPALEDGGTGQDAEVLDLLAALQRSVDRRGASETASAGRGRAGRSRAASGGRGGTTRQSGKTTGASGRRKSEGPGAGSKKTPVGKGA